MWKMQYIFIGVFLMGSASQAQTQVEKRLPEVTVTEAAEKNKVLYLPNAVGTNIFTAKKTSVADLEELPPIPNSNYRQLFAQLPGILTSEVSNEGLASFNYRGLGDPHETFNVNILKDGIPISADPLGYPANYYQPPAPTIEKIELIRGGSALLYGPQPGAALNYITRKPKFDSDLKFSTNQTVGSKEFYSTYNEVSYGDDEAAFLGSYHRRQSEGFREENSDYYVNNGVAKAAFKSDSGAKWLLDFDVYEGSFGEAGGLTLEQGPGLATYGIDRNATTLLNDRLTIERYAATASLDYDLSRDSKISAKLFTAHYWRTSRRQDVGVAPAFGGFPTAQTNTIVTQEFNNLGLDLRAKQDYELLDNTSSVSGGVFVNGSYSPFRSEKGDNPGANTGILNKLFYRNTTELAAFVENEFNFGDLKIVPGFRVENIYLDLKERVDTASLDEDLRRENKWYNEPLFGIGAAYNLTNEVELYANLSQSYKPVAFQDLIPLNTGDVISSDLDPAKALTGEVGFRGSLSEFAKYDVSLFRTEYDNQFGRVGKSIQNVGRGLYKGVEFSTNFALLSAARELMGYETSKEFGELNWFTNVTVLDAEFTDGPSNGLEPQFAPGYLIRTGATYEYSEKFRFSFIGTFVDNSFADDAETLNRYIPSYEVFDLLGEYKITEQVHVNFGVNNLFDEKYYSRIRSNGIDPALPVNVFAGITLLF